MSDNTDRQGGSAGAEGHGGRDSLAELLRQAGPRAEIPRATEERLRAVAREALARKRAGRRRTQAVRWLAAAASLVLLAWAVRTFPPGGKVDPLVVASVEYRSGAVQVPGEHAASSDVVAHQELATAAGETLTLKATTGHSIRLHSETTARFAAARLLELQAGSVYVDSGGDGAGMPLSIRTPFGVVTELGTRYQVDVAESGLEVRVRGGSVAVDGAAGRHRADAGFLLAIDRQGTVSLEPSPTYGTGWGWVLEAAVAPEIDGRPLRVLLDWVVRETGWELEFDDIETATTAPEIGLSGSVGSIRGLSPEEALTAVLPTCGLEYRVASGRLIISGQAPI